MILAATIQKRLEDLVDIKILSYQFDCRYLSRWITLYPQCFPVYMRKGNFSITFNSVKLRYEINKI